MRKKITCLALLLALSLVIPAEASAAGGWTVTFDGKAMESNFKSSDIDDAVNDMEPGDTAEFHITLKNTGANAADWYMANTILTTMEDNSRASGGAYDYKLSYTAPDGTVTTLYDSTVGGEDGTGGTGLKQADSALGDYFYLGSLASGKSGAVDLSVKLDGSSGTNLYQTRRASLQVNFAVEEAAAGGAASGVSSRNVVKTGDQTRIMLYICLAAFAAGLILLILAMRRLRGEAESPEDAALDSAAGTEPGSAGRRR